MVVKGRVLIVDDDPALGTVVGALLRQDGHEVVTVEGGEAAMAALDKQHVDVVLSDIRMPGMSGMQLLEKVEEQRPNLPVILLTAHGTVPLAVEAMKRGAADFLLKPFEREEILFVVRKALTAAARNDVAPERPLAPLLIGESSPMRQVQERLRRAARGMATVLIRGESGTGKELIARALHEASARSGGPFVKLHCAALPETLLESELFGYEKGAFTGAATRKPGRIELANAGTLFLDEIGDVPLSMQVKLLRVLQERELERLGGRDTVRVDVRFIAATHRDLEALVAAGQFREDLFYRLNVLPLWLPPLRERREDIKALARHFVDLHTRVNQRPDMKLDADALASLVDEPWPGNVRQLENFIERLVVLSDGAVLTADDVRREMGRAPLVRDESAAAGADFTLETRQRKAENEALSAALERAGNNRTLAARLLGISRRTLYTKLEQHGLL